VAWSTPLCPKVNLRVGEQECCCRCCSWYCPASQDWLRLPPQLSVGVNGAWYFGDSIRYGIDAAYENSRFALKGEFLGQGRNRASLSDDRGWYGLGAVFVVPTVQAVGKYEEFARPGLSAGSKSRAWTAGLNVYPRGQNLRLTFDYVSRKTEEPETQKGRLLAQVQAKF
jgi:hypothetical protein